MVIVHSIMKLKSILYHLQFFLLFIGISKSTIGQPPEPAIIYIYDNTLFLGL